MRKVCLFNIQNNKILEYDYQHGDTFVSEIHEVRKGMWAFFRNGAIRMLGT